MVDGEVTRLITEAHDRAREILTRDRELLGRLADVLIAREVIEGKDLHAYVEGALPIPTAADLKREAEQKAADNGQNATQEIKPGPAIRPSAPVSESTLPDAIPARPD